MQSYLRLQALELNLELTQDLTAVTCEGQLAVAQPAFGIEVQIRLIRAFLKDLDIQQMVFRRGRLRVSPKT
jgi:hypothetical protein